MYDKIYYKLKKKKDFILKAVLHLTEIVEEGQRAAMCPPRSLVCY